MNKFCEENDFLCWFETSAKKNMGIDEGCRLLVHYILKNDLKPAKDDATALKVTGGDSESRGMEEKDFCYC